MPLQQPRRLAPILHGMVAQGPQGAGCCTLSSAMGSHCTEGCDPAPRHGWVLRAFPRRGSLGTRVLPCHARDALALQDGREPTVRAAGCSSGSGLGFTFPMGNFATR